MSRCFKVLEQLCGYVIIAYGVRFNQYCESHCKKWGWILIRNF